MSWIEVSLHPPKPLSWWLSEFSAGRINMSPGYQRRSNLWGKWKRAHLIDSIINGFDVPKFYVADFNRSPGGELRETPSVYAVIDGKQRFEALFAFFNDVFPLNDDATLIVEPGSAIANLTFSQLSKRYPRIAERLESFVPVVMSVGTDTRGLVEQLFVRLNSGVSINGAERRNAMPGPVPGIVRDITVHSFFGERVRFSVDRMQEFNLAAKLLMFEHGGSFAETKARNLDVFVLTVAKQVKPIVLELDTTTTDPDRRADLERELASIEAPYKAAEERVMQNLGRLNRVFINRDPLLKKQGAIPVYYWFIRQNPGYAAVFRDFLREFEPAVLVAVRVARVNPDDADPELLSYYNATRTSNDKQSMVLRYAIICKRLEAWLIEKGKPVLPFVPSNLPPIPRLPATPAPLI
ncbi:DUF262 domain-containing protein [Stenotrophomonas rhizophila]|uniref:DUF262 domain-containing protein n=1 Tax=Stenotrophomonas rhizophila TaxID=216778 RepID=UPI003AF6D7A2